MDTKKEVTIPRVLHLHFGKDGGAERFFVNLVNALGERGVEQRFIIRPRRSWRREIEALGPIIENHYRYISFSSLLLQWRVRRMPSATLIDRPSGYTSTSLATKSVSTALEEA